MADTSTAKTTDAKDTPKEDTKTQSQENPPPDKELAAQVRDLQNTIAAMRVGAPLSLIPEHGAGPEDAVRPTWSQADQEESRKRFG